MLPYDFARLRDSANQEALRHAVFQEAHDRWTFEGRHSINESQLVVICVETFFGEVNNGGLWQYLSNGSGRNASFGPTALQRVGLPKYAEILEETLKRCINVLEENDFGILEDYYEASEAYDDDEHFEDLEQRYSDLYYPNKTEYAEKIYRFIIENETDFISAP